MLVMKAWLETRWRLLATFVYLLICLFIYYHNQKADFSNARGFFLALRLLSGIRSVDSRRIGCEITI